MQTGAGGTTGCVCAGVDNRKLFTGAYSQAQPFLSHTALSDPSCLLSRSIVDSAHQTCRIYSDLWVRWMAADTLSLYPNWNNIANFQGSVYTTVTDVSCGTLTLTSNAIGGRCGTTG